MILAIDVGNTNIVIGGLEGEKQVFSARCSTDRNKTADEYALTFQGILAMRGIQPESIEGGILSSVVPTLRTTLPIAVKQLAGKDILVVSPDLRTDLTIKMDNPYQMGSDLLVDAVAAKAKYKGPLAVFDMGTATTMSVIDAEGSYIGGLIIPGLRTSMDALSARAAQLPFINLGEPKVFIGKNTIDCMQAGAIYSCAAMLDGLVDRTEEALGMPVTAVLTGGLSGVIAPHCKRDIKLEPDLLTEGLRILYEKNR